MPSKTFYDTLGGPSGAGGAEKEPKVCIFEGDERYKVDAEGNVYSYCTGKEVVRKYFLNHRGYPVITFHIGGKTKGIFVHRIVAQAFIPNPLNKKTVNHKNGVKTDFRVENLEWATQGENNKHAYDTGLTVKRKGESHRQSKLSDESVREILISPKPMRALAREFSVDPRLIRRIRKGLSRSYLTAISNHIKINNENDM